jgi:hypothetical protein
MYGKSASLGVEGMNRANEDIRQKTSVDILNTTLILLKKESTRYDKQLSLAWNHAHVLNPKGMELMDEAFNNGPEGRHNYLPQQQCASRRILLVRYELIMSRSLC